MPAQNVKLSDTKNGIFRSDFFI